MIKIMDYSKTSNDEIFARGISATGVEDIVSGIIEDVKINKDKALYKYCEKFDNTITDNLEVSEAELEEAFNSVDEHFIDVIKKAKENIFLSLFYYINEVFVNAIKGFLQLCFRNLQIISNCIIEFLTVFIKCFVFIYLYILYNS